MDTAGVTMRIFDTKDKHEFKPLLMEVEDKPTSPLARWLLWTIFAFIVITLLWLYFAKVDIVVSGQGKALPTGEIKIVQPLETGVIKSILVKEGQEVKKEQTLMVLDPFVNETNLEALEDTITTLELDIKRIDALLNDKAFNSNNIVQNNLFSTTKNNMQNLQQLYQNAKKEEQNLRKIKDIISNQEYTNIKDKMLQYKQQIITNKNTLLEQLNSNQKELINLKAQLQSTKFKNQKQLITSPVDGYVGKLLIHTEGGVVSPAEKLITIIPKDEPLVFKVSILNQDIGFIKEDMNVSVKVNTFNFQKYGLIDGIVTHISDDAIEDEKLGLVYEVFIKPSKYHLEYGGKKHHINSGMGITAEVKIGKRRVVNFFIYPLIRYMDEGMSVR
jgi:hemolysin D